MKLKILRHELYCVPATVPDIRGEDGKVIIHLTEKYKAGYIDTGEELVWMQIIGKGTRVGTKRYFANTAEGRSMRSMFRERKWSTHMPDCYSIGDLILTPIRSAWGYKRVGLIGPDYNDVFIDEVIPVCAWRDCCDMCRSATDEFREIYVDGEKFHVCPTCAKTRS
jgi:hypothetical protein